MMFFIYYTIRTDLQAKLEVTLCLILLEVPKTQKISKRSTHEGLLYESYVELKFMSQYGNKIICYRPEKMI